MLEEQFWGVGACGTGWETLRKKAALIKNKNLSFS